VRWRTCAEVFLLLGAAGLACTAFVACPAASAGSARAVAAAAVAGFLGVFGAACARDRLEALPGPAVVPLGALAYLHTRWVAAEAAERRVLWRLGERRRREWAALWRALTNLLPEDVLRDRYRAGPAAGACGRRRPALALFADLVG
jgi:hypothetical protein